VKFYNILKLPLFTSHADGLSNNDNMETEEAQEDQHLADRLNRMTTNTSEIKSVSTGSKLF